MSKNTTFNIGEESKKARALVTSGQAKTIKEAWAMLKKEREATTEKKLVKTERPRFYNGLW